MNLNLNFPKINRKFSNYYIMKNHNNNNINHNHNCIHNNIRVNLRVSDNRKHKCHIHLLFSNKLGNHTNIMSLSLKGLNLIR